MSVERFPDRRAVMFGRAPDVATLLGRCSDKDAPPNGVTFLTGRPKAGKSWLLRELGRQLVEMDFLVGYAESSGATTDLALWAVADAYEQWLGSSTWRKQGQSLLERHKKNLVGKVGRAVAEAAEVALKAQGKPLGGNVRDLFAGLAAADRDLQTGGLALAPLPYDVTRDLADLLHRLSEKTVVLVFDAWEQSPRLTHEAGLLDAYLRNAEDWPPTHLFVAVRVEDQESEAVRKARTLSRLGPYAALIRLGDMRVEEDPTERDRFLSHLRQLIGDAARDLDDAALLDEVAGYPGVVEYWTAAARRHALPDAETLEQLAEDAQQLRYRDLEAALTGLQKDDPVTFDLALQLTLLPEIGSPAGWEIFGRVLHPQEDLDSRVADLRDRGVLDLESLAYPTFGHSTRYEAARRWALTSPKLAVAQVTAKRLLPRLAAEIRSTELVVVPYALALADFSLSEILRRLQLPSADLLLSFLARRVLKDARVELNDLHLTAKSLSTLHPEANALLAIGLLNALNDAKQEEVLERRDQLLDELRRLAGQYSDGPAVREWLAKGLFNTLNHAEQEEAQERRDELLAELRRLAETHPDDPAVREWLAKGLVNTLVYTKQEKALERRDQLLDELRALAKLHPADPAVREPLAKGLFNTLNDARQEEALERRGQLLDELRRLTDTYPDDPAVRERLAKGLFNTLNDAKQEEVLERRDQLLDELRRLAEQHPGDPAVREQLAMGLLNTLKHAKQEEALERRDQLLDELRRLAETHPDDPAVRERLAMGLFSTLIDAKQEEALERRDHLLDELRELDQEHGVVRKVISLLTQQVGRDEAIAELRELGFTEAEAQSLSTPPP